MSCIKCRLNSVYSSNFHRPVGQSEPGYLSPLIPHKCTPGVLMTRSEGVDGAGWPVGEVGEGGAGLGVLGGVWGGGEGTGAERDEVGKWRQGWR